MKGNTSGIARTAKTTAAGFALAAALVIGLTVGPTQSASAVSAGCSSGRCTVYLTKAETASLGRGAIPSPPGFVPPQVRVAYYATAYAHRFFASQYAARGMCSAFRLSIYPWETQGYFGYRC